ncbi:MAG: hypothetical protein HY923_09545 [Elusimicrobia bacterium]|nr:hypothetical protein [Elusimicrobiota bacterium]
MAAKLLLLIALFARPAFAADALIGSWDKDGAPASVVRADHTARIGSDEVKWIADGKTLRLTYANGETETMSYSIRGNVLTVTMDGESEVYTRSAAKAGKAAKAPPAEKAGSDKLSTMLLSEGAGELGDAELKVSRNSNGYPILNAGGKEYSSCN